MEGKNIAAISQQMINTTDCLHLDFESFNSLRQSISQEKIESLAPSLSHSFSHVEFNARLDLEFSGNLLTNNLPDNNSIAVAAAGSDAEGDYEPEESATSSSSSGFLRVKKSPVSAEGDGAVESTDDDKEKLFSGLYEWEFKVIPVYERFNGRNDVEIVNVRMINVRGYGSFASEMCLKQPHVEESLKDAIPNVLWPWVGYEIQYMELKDETEKLLDPISIYWLDFVLQLNHIVAKRQDDTNVIPVTIHGKKGAVVQTNIHLNFVKNFETFVNILHYVCVGWIRNKDLAGEDWNHGQGEPQPLKKYSLVGLGTLGISLYDGNGRELEKPWFDSDDEGVHTEEDGDVNMDMDMDMEEDGEKKESDIDNDGEEKESDIDNDGENIEDEDMEENQENEIDETHSYHRGVDAFSPNLKNYDLAHQHRFEEMYPKLKSVVIRQL